MISTTTGARACAPDYTNNRSLSSSYNYFIALSITPAHAGTYQCVCFGMHMNCEWREHARMQLVRASSYLLGTSICSTVLK